MSDETLQRELSEGVRQKGVQAAEYSLSNAARTKKYVLCVGRDGFPRYSGWSMDVLDEAVVCENAAKKGGTAGFEVPRPFVSVRMLRAGAFCV